MPGPIVASAVETPDNVFSTQTLNVPGLTSGDSLYVAYGSDFYPFATMPNVTSTAGTCVLVKGTSLGDGVGHLKTFVCAVQTTGDHTVTIPAHTDCDIHGIVLVIPGAVTVDASDSLIDTANTTDFHAAPSLATTGLDRLLVCVWLTPSGPAWTGEPYQPQSPMVEWGETGASPFSAMMVAVEAIPAAGATGTRTAQWIAARKYAAISVALAGAGGAPDITGDLAAVLPALTTSATADVTVAGTIDAQLPPIQAAASATVEVDATIAATLPAPTASLTGDVAATPEGVLAATLPAITAALTGTSDAIALPEVTVTVGPAQLGWPVGPARLLWPVGPADLGGE